MFWCKLPCLLLSPSLKVIFPVASQIYCRCPPWVIPPSKVCIGNNYTRDVWSLHVMRTFSSNSQTCKFSHLLRFVNKRGAVPIQSKLKKCLFVRPMEEYYRIHKQLLIGWAHVKSPPTAFQSSEVTNHLFSVRETI